MADHLRTAALHPVSGRRKGVRNFATDVKDALKAPVKITRDGKRHTISTQEALLLRLREKALGGDARALDRMVQLAQSYSDEKMAAVDSVSADDAAVLDIYKARLLKGLTAPGAVERAPQSAETGPVSEQAAVAEMPDAAPLKRARLTKHPRHDHERNAEAEDERK